MSVVNKFIYSLWGPYYQSNSDISVDVLNTSHEMVILVAFPFILCGGGLEDTTTVYYLTVSRAQSPVVVLSMSSSRLVLCILGSLSG